MSTEAPPVRQAAHFLTQGPVLPLMLRMAAPTIAVMVIQGVVSAAEVYFVGRLGSEAIAGVSLCYPVLMLMMSMSAAGMGSGVSSAIARAVGAHKQREAESLIFHALLIAVGAGVLFTVIMHFGGRPLYAAMGGRGATLDNAVIYSSVFFNAAILVWVFNTLTAVFRGCGSMMFPAVVGAWGGLIVIIASPTLIFGLGPFPAMGIVGASLAVVFFYVIGIVVLTVRLFSHKSPLRPHVDGWRYERSQTWEIMRVGLPSSANAIISSGNAVLMTGLVGPFGPAALAGFGLGTRLEYIIMPVIFGFGMSVLTIVGASVGAGDIGRARYATRIGATIAAAFTGSMGVFLMLFPDVWLTRFTQDAAVLAVGEAYFHRVGFVYTGFGMGMICYTAAQGLGRAAIPMWLSLLRLALLIPGAIWAGRNWGLHGVFVAMACGYAFFGVTLTLAMIWVFRNWDR